METGTEIPQRKRTVPASRKNFPSPAIRLGEKVDKDISGLG
jgi:hypothetical protein